jgi:hypothetical protein
MDIIDTLDDETLFHQVDRSPKYGSGNGVKPKNTSWIGKIKFKPTGISGFLLDLQKQIILIACGS